MRHKTIQIFNRNVVIFVQYLDNRCQINGILRMRTKNSQIYSSIAKPFFLSGTQFENWVNSKEPLTASHSFPWKQTICCWNLRKSSAPWRHVLLLRLWTLSRYYNTLHHSCRASFVYWAYFVRACRVTTVQIQIRSSGRQIHAHNERDG